MYGQKLHHIRKNLNLSQEEMAQKTNTSYRAYTSYERGDRKPSFEFLEQLALNFEVNLNWLIANNGNPFLGNRNTLSLKEEILNDVKDMLIKEGVLKK